MQRFVGNRCVKEDVELAQVAALSHGRREGVDSRIGERVGRKVERKEDAAALRDSGGEVLD
jgi:hypothetical protein